MSEGNGVTGREFERLSGDVRENKNGITRIEKRVNDADVVSRDRHARVMTAIDELTKLIRDTHAGCATRDEYHGHNDRIGSLERSRDRAKTAGKVVGWLGAPAVALLNWDAMSDFLKSFFR